MISLMIPSSVGAYQSGVEEWYAPMELCSQEGTYGTTTGCLLRRPIDVIALHEPLPLRFRSQDDKIGSHANNLCNRTGSKQLPIWQLSEHGMSSWSAEPITII